MLFCIVDIYSRSTRTCHIFQNLCLVLFFLVEVILNLINCVGLTLIIIFEYLETFFLTVHGMCKSVILIANILRKVGVIGGGSLNCFQ